MLRRTEEKNRQLWKLYKAELIWNQYELRPGEGDEAADVAEDRNESSKKRQGYEPGSEDGQKRRVGLKRSACPVGRGSGAGKRKTYISGPRVTIAGRALRMKL
jgi:hypothetical protein